MSSQPPSTRAAVFLSYAREDSEPARRIADALRAFGVEVWFDQSELRGGVSPRSSAAAAATAGRVGELHGSVADAIGSVARYLHYFGWQRGLPTWQVLGSIAELEQRLRSAHLCRLKRWTPWARWALRG